MFEIPFSQNIVTALNHSKMISLTKNSVFQSIIDHYFEDEKISLDKTMEVNSYIGAASLAIQRLGISIVLTDILPYLDKTQEFNIVKIPKSALNLDVGISIHKDSSEKVKKVAERMLGVIDQEMR
ncbi:LysR substrate-binding domain-containing protein [Lactobacillus taiwanensis]|uniref:LysR substrate-binding domain-containing protein n=1 Tax=Lactobacillus taiwanensis TaxID=508451 RepID=UPI00338ED079